MMNIDKLDILNYSNNLDNDSEYKYELFKEEYNKRIINIFKLNNVKVSGKLLFYPNSLLFSHDSNKLYNPIRETTMSLKNVDINKKYGYLESDTINTYTNPVFFFIYNLDNYYHFLYDTLPYLITFKYLKQKYNNIKLLINYPNLEKNEFYKFNIEFFNLLDITMNDLIFVNSNTKYKKLFISSSYTHDYLSNCPPHNKIYKLYEKIRYTALKRKVNIDLYKNIYISRRTHLHNNLSNIGTNYTQRRKMMNEDNLVDTLQKYNYKEVFTENLTTIEKIHLFYHCKNIVGSIGGGIANVIFSKPDTNLYAIISPGFLDINSRFSFCLDTVNCKYIDNTFHFEKTEFKKYMRIKDKLSNIIGEIEETKNNHVIINYIDNTCAGWNYNINYKNKIVYNDNIIKLDNGLNSSYILDINKLISIF